MQFVKERSGNLTEEIRTMMAEKLMVEVGSPEDDLLETGLIDSLSLVQLLVNLEEQYEIKIPLNELQLEDVRSIASLAHLVASRRVDAEAHAA